MRIQKTDWGHIEWMENEAGGIFIQGLNVGLVVLETGANHPPHKHYDEQVNYVVQGQAVAYIDGKEITMKPGNFYHWPMGVVHEAYNIGNVPFVHLMISSSENATLEEFVKDKKKKWIEGTGLLDRQTGQLYIAVEAIRTQFLETLRYPYVIFDGNGNRISQSKTFPAYCTQICDPAAHDGMCECMLTDQIEQFQQEKTFFCPHGIEIFSIPLIDEKHFLGYIQGGYIWQSQYGNKPDMEIYDTPESTAIGIKNLLRRIAKAVKNYCEFEQYRIELEEREAELFHSRQSQRMLVKDLKDVKSEMTDLKISNHFLFNTLNSMAAMALDGGVTPLYESIVDLSKLFHYNLKNRGMLVPLRKEIEYLQAYLKLQKLRYGEQLHIIYDIDERLYSCKVPFNFLQPVAENAFVHGFQGKEEKRLEIHIHRREESMEILITNTGTVLSARECYSINQRIMGKVAHGLSMVRNKLQSVYDKNFQMEILSDKEQKTRVRIAFPLNPQKRGD